MSIAALILAAGAMAGCIVLGFVVDAQRRTIGHLEAKDAATSALEQVTWRQVQHVAQDAATALSKWEAWEHNQASTTTDLDLPDLKGDHHD